MSDQATIIEESDLSCSASVNVDTVYILVSILGLLSCLRDSKETGEGQGQIVELMWKVHMPVMRKLGCLPHAQHVQHPDASGHSCSTV